MKKYLLNSGLLLLTVILVLLIVSCENQMAPSLLDSGISEILDSSDPSAADIDAEDSAEAPSSAYVYKDPSSGTAVYVDSRGMITPIESEEESGKIGCSEIIEFIPIEVKTPSLNKSDIQSEYVKAFVLGKRSDGYPGLWAVYSAGRVSPVINSDGFDTSKLLEMVEGRQPMSGYFSWSYNALNMVSNTDGSEIIITGYAESSGVKWHNFTIESGTTIGVYWSVLLGDDGYYHISRAKVIGYKDYASRRDYYKNYRDNYRKYRKSEFRHNQRWMWVLRMFFAGWYDKYIIMPENVDSGENDGEYYIYGMDQDNEGSVAVVTAVKVLSIEDYEDPGVVDNQPPTVIFPEGDYAVSSAGTAAVNGFYEETGTINSFSLYNKTSGGDYKIFHAYFSGNSAPLPAAGNFWCIDTDETTASLSDIDYWRYSNDSSPNESGWYDQSGEASDLVISPVIVFSGSTDLYGTLTINYIFTDTDGDLEGDSGFRWFRYDPTDDNDPGTLIANAAGESYTTTADDEGMYLRVEITPVDERQAVGGAALSSSSGIIGY